MNYSHAFHAGNFADVHKHIVLLALLEHLHKKPTPFFVLDTHAGRGVYDLTSTEAERSGEWRSGISRLLAAPIDVPEVTNYLCHVQHAQATVATSSSTARFYPGSPLLIAGQLRNGDRAVFVEKHPLEAEALKATLHRYSHIAVLTQDGYAALKAELPPKENRGLVLIDPPYEAADEFMQLADALRMALKRWSNGTYCVWYPIKAGGAHERFLQQLRAAGIKKLLLVELSVKPADSPLGLNGSGLLIVNPPYQLDARMQAILPQLQRVLALEKVGDVRIEWLAGE
ncbi:MAG: 23S rRNA (adenine(2030)-N(6))-methyltransferase RlmJ [Candidatus Obscuribacterales bacterium]|nr:23S rRNA (adenine(2030)-N(6))-methyltransferase RlmJ [Steroidobacteraceae bacterium]